MCAGFSLEVDVVDHDVVVIAASGEIDRSTVPQLSDSLRRAALAGRGPVLVDLGSVSFLDTSAISVLLGALRRLKRGGRKLLLACPPGNVRRLFELTGLAATFAVFPNRQAALAHA